MVRFLILALSLGVSSASSGKRGYAYNDAALVQSIASRCIKCSWAYNWSTTDNGMPPDIEFVPMLWGNREQFTAHWEANVQSMIEKGATHVLSFNEPDHALQASMDAATAAAVHAQHMDPSRVRAKIGSPAVTSSTEAGKGLEWLTEFLRICRVTPGCQVDFCAVHWYGTMKEMKEGLAGFVDAAHDACGGLPVWLTELGVVDPAMADAGDVTTVLAGLDGKGFLERYAWFMLDTGPGHLLEPNGAWTSLGEVYASG